MTTLTEYNKEIQPKIRNLLQQKELLKDFIDSDEECQELVQEVNDASKALKSAVEKSERGAELLEAIKAIELDIKLAIKAAARGTEYKAAELKAFMFARAKESVDKVVDKGELFDELKKELE